MRVMERFTAPSYSNQELAFWVEPADSAAANAGLEKGGVIIFADRAPVNTAADLQRVLHARTSGKPALLQIRREGTMLFMALG